MRSEFLLAVIALRVDLFELGLEGLLDGDFVIKSFLDLDFDENSLRVLLGPYEVRLEEFQFRQSAQFFQAHSEQLF